MRPIVLFFHRKNRVLVLIYVCVCSVVFFESNFEKFCKKSTWTDVHMVLYWACFNILDFTLFFRYDFPRSFSIIYGICVSELAWFISLNWIILLIKWIGCVFHFFELNFVLRWCFELLLFNPLNLSFFEFSCFLAFFQSQCRTSCSIFCVLIC